jgi:hypothetical protein
MDVKRYALEVVDHLGEDPSLKMMAHAAIDWAAMDQGILTAGESFM